MANPVLIVEDDALVRESLQMVLEAYDFSVLSASNGKEALDILKSGTAVCLVLLDIMMPVMNGWDFLEAKAADEKLAEIPVVILSAADARHPVAKLAVSFLPKPISVDSLVHVLQKYCKN